MHISYVTCTYPLGSYGVLYLVEDINQRRLDEAKDMQTWCMHMHALFVPYIFQILLYDICTHIQNRCAYARVFCITEVSGCSKTLLCGNPGFPMKQHVLLVKVWSMWALEAVFGGARSIQARCIMTMEWNWKNWNDFVTLVMKPWDILRLFCMQFLHGSFLTVLGEDQEHYPVSCSCVRVWHPSLRGR